jgi:anti-sigma factor RsiW
MMHERTLELLDDYLDGELTPREERDVRRHLMQCEPCREQEAALRRLLDSAAELPEEILPGRDLWSGIAARLEPRAELRERQARDAAVVVPLPRRRPVPAWMRAAATVVLVAGATLLALRLPERRAAPEVEPVAAAGVAATADAALVAFQPVEREYRAAIDDLARVLEERRGELAPQTVRVLEENLRVIDAAIEESRQALEADPASRELTRMLADAYNAKLGVLRLAVQL